MTDRIAVVLPSPQARGTFLFQKTPLVVALIPKNAWLFYQLAKLSLKMMSWSLYFLLALANNPSRLVLGVGAKFHVDNKDSSSASAAIIPNIARGTYEYKGTFDEKAEIDVCWGHSSC